MNFLKEGFLKLLDIILPRSAYLKELEDLSAEEFWQKAEKSSDGPDGNIFAIFKYGDPLVRTAIWQVKYRQHLKVAELLGEILYVEIMEELSTLSQFSNFTSPVLMPIPLSPARLKSRGYNQAEFLARGVMKFDKGKNLELLTKVLTKTKERPPQSSLPRALRLKNLRSSFAVTAPEKIRGRNIILIDDVTTTGATIKEARRALVRAGARKVIAFVVAH